jgi:predicted NAD/FAD-dependent oxidoreductase
MSNSHIRDIVVIGAGISGLICAQGLRQAGYQVLVLEKSRGVGGRVATRRLQETCADHGACYIKPKTKLLSQLIEFLGDRNLIELWTDTVFEHQPITGLILQNSASCYVPSQGMSAIAKTVFQPGLSIQKESRVIQIHQDSANSWCLTLENNTQIHTKAVVIAIPAPQARDLLTPLDPNLLGTEFINHLNSVEFDPCISVMVGYSPNSQPLPEWKALTFNDNPDLGWIGFDSSKRPQPQPPHFVIQSSADLAQQHLETQDLQPIGNYMLQKAAAYLALPWLEHPEWIQVHRWRYAFPRTPLDITCLPANTSLPLVCCGDWCGGNFIAGVIRSGLAAAQKIDNQLNHLLPANINFGDFLQKCVTANLSIDQNITPVRRRRRRASSQE